MDDSMIAPTNAARRSKRAFDSLAALGENGLLHLLTGHWKTDTGRILSGVGDDCAVLHGEGKNHFLLFKTDAIVEGVHFATHERPELIGRKALSRALSDLAAMGASPLAAVVTLGVPEANRCGDCARFIAASTVSRKNTGSILLAGRPPARSNFSLTWPCSANAGAIGRCSDQARGQGTRFS